MSNARALHAALRRALAFALALIVAACLAGCSWVDERAVRAGVAEALDRFEQSSAEGAVTLFEDAGIDVSELVAAGIDVESFAQHAFAHFGYDIVDVSVDGGVAEVRLQITNVDCRAAMAALVEEMAGKASDYDEILLHSDGERELVEAYFAELSARLDAAAPETNEVTVRFVKEEGAWHLDGAGEDELAQALFGDERP